MGLSQSDIVSIAGFARKTTKASTVEVVLAEAFKALRAIGDINEMRIVYSRAPSTWNHCRATVDSLVVQHHEEWPAPAKKGVTIFFDSANEQSSYVSIDKTGEKPRSALEIMAPEIWSALLLQSALVRVQKAAVSEIVLVREALRARDEERRRIALELHDDLGQSMAALRLTLKWVEDLVRPKPGMREVVKALSEARQDVGTMLIKIRDLSHTLHPPVLDTLGLIGALKELVRQAGQHSSVAIECTSRGKPRPLTKDIGVGLYRCCQEAISNAIRHSKASKLEIFIRFAKEEVRVTVEDNGKGFDPRTLYDSNARMMSSGFWAIRQRMADLGGAFRVSTAEERGTVVELIVPYSPGKTNATRENKTAHSG